MTSWVDGLLGKKDKVEEHPVPEVYARQPSVDELPGGAKAILRACAKSSGWYCWTTYARGTKPTRTRPVVDSVLVKGHHAARKVAFVVEYLKTDEGTWTVECAYWATGKPLTAEAVSISELKGRIDP